MSIDTMKAPCVLLVLGLFASGCVNSQRQSGNLARFMVTHLQEYGANFPHIDLAQPAIGIPQLHTSWRSHVDPGGFTLEFKPGAYEYVDRQIRGIAGPGRTVPGTEVRVWQISGIAHIDLARLPNGNVQLTCRRLGDQSTPRPKP